jgi:hypothetical protein
MNFPTVYEMIRISNDAVANALIDQRQVETTLLLNRRENVGSDCGEAFLLNGDQILFKPSYRYYSCSSRSARILTRNNDELIK